MGEGKVLDGNEAAAYGVKLSRPEVVALFPITPQTTMIHKIAEFIASGELRAKAVTVENEHSSMSVVAGASAAGSRTFTSSAAQGVVHMEEVLWMVPGNRLPVVMAICTRSISMPGGLQCTHNDALLQRDNGWLQLYCENAQEVLDTSIQVYKIAEDRRVSLPIHFCLDGYLTSACAIPVDIPDQKEVDDFLPPYNHEYFYLDPENPPKPKPGISYENVTEVRYQIEEAHNNALNVIKEVNNDYRKRFGRSYGNGLLEEYRTEGARAVLITMGSITGSARVTIDEMRAEGKPIGLVNLRSFRPFPTDDLRNIAKKVEAIGFVDRNISHGAAAGGGIGTIETARALYSLEEKPFLLGFIAGIEGRDVNNDTIRYMADKVLKVCDTRKVQNEVEWVQLRK